VIVSEGSASHKIETTEKKLLKRGRGEIWGGGGGGGTVRSALNDHMGAESTVPSKRNGREGKKKEAKKNSFGFGNRKRRGGRVFQGIGRTG